MNGRMFTRRGFITSVAASAVIAGAVTIVPEFLEQARQRTGQIAEAKARSQNARKLLLQAANFEGAQALFKADGSETSDENGFDVVVWHGAKNEITVMAATGPWAGLAATFQPVAGTLRLKRFAYEEKLDVFGDVYSWPQLLERPGERVVPLRDFPAPGDSTSWPKRTPSYIGADGKHKLFRVTGAIVKGNAFEIAFGRQHKLAINLTSGSYVYNTYAQSTFYGRIPALTQEASARLHP